MKKMSKLTKKLLFSALALGLAVVTLTTTTFAWYTSSTTATATGGSETSGTTEDTTLLISTNQSDWGKSVKISSQSSLVPVQWNGTSFVPLGEGTATSTDYFQFTIYFKTTKSVIENQTNEDIPVYLKSLVLSNIETKQLAAHDNLLGADTEVSGAPNYKEYKVDAVRALDIVINGTAYDLSGTQQYKTGLEGGFNKIENADALAYYNAVTFDKEADYLKCEEDLETLNLDGTFVLTTLTAGSSSYGVQSVTFTIYLNGWDQYCFDACKGQEFTLDMSFSTIK